MLFAGDVCTGKVCGAEAVRPSRAPLGKQKCQYFIRRMHISRSKATLENPFLSKNHWFFPSDWKPKSQWKASRSQQCQYFIRRMHISRSKGTLENAFLSKNHLFFPSDWKPKSQWKASRSQKCQYFIRRMHISDIRRVLKTQNFKSRVLKLFKRDYTKS